VTVNRGPLTGTSNKTTHTGGGKTRVRNAWISRCLRVGQVTRGAPGHLPRSGQAGVIAASTRSPQAHQCHGSTRGAEDRSSHIRGTWLELPPTHGMARGPDLPKVSTQGCRPYDVDLLTPVGMSLRASGAQRTPAP
jgi:hypothetical protein